jgi:hypothetical protein
MTEMLNLLFETADQATTAPAEAPDVVAIFGEPTSGARIVPQPTCIAFAELLQEPHFIRFNPLPEPYELRSFCLCAIDESCGGCMRRPRKRAPHRVHRAGSRAAGARDDGGGDGPSDPPPHLTVRFLPAPSVLPREAAMTTVRAFDLVYDAVVP